MTERSAKISRRKAHPDHYPDEGHVAIRTAYGDLSQEAFSSWIRLCVEPPRTRLCRRKAVAALLGYSPRRCGVILDELRRKNYIRVSRLDIPGKPIEVHIERRPLIRAADGFVRLS